MEMKTASWITDAATLSTHACAPMHAHPCMQVAGVIQPPSTVQGRKNTTKRTAAWQCNMAFNTRSLKERLV